MNIACGGMAKRNTARTPAISQTAFSRVIVVTEFERILAYQSAMAQARAMIKKMIITDGELLGIEALMAKKYGFTFGDIHRDLDLITLASRGNMPYYEGGV